MTDKLLNTECEWNAAKCSGAEETQIHSKRQMASQNHFSYSWMLGQSISTKLKSSPQEMDTSGWDIFFDYLAILHVSPGIHVTSTIERTQ
jgi:hypothetical protein